MNKRPHHNTPPKWINSVLDWYCKEEYSNEIRGDLMELYDRWLEKGKFSANVKYVLNAVLFMRLYNAKMNSGQNKTQLGMYNHYFKIASRNLLRHKGFTLTNIIGLSISICISFMIFLHVDQELSYEKSYPKHDKIYRLATKKWAKSAPLVAEKLRGYMSQIKNTSRFAVSDENAMVKAQNEEQPVIAKQVLYADSSTIDMFDFEFVFGGKNGAMSRPNTVIIVESLSAKLFKKTNPIGQTIQIYEEPYEVTGVIKDLPTQSHIKAEVLIPMQEFYEKVPTEWLEWRTWMALYTYVQIDSKADLQEVNSRLLDFQYEYMDWESGDTEVTAYIAEGNAFELMSITDIHLYSDKTQELGPNSNGVYIYIFIVLAVFILIIACVNFINIFVTLSINRIKEIGIRKVIGAYKNQLVHQFMGEAYLTVLISGMVALILCVLALPIYNSFSELSLQESDLFSARYLLPLLALCMVIGLISGGYPAFVVSRFQIVKALSVSKEVKAGIPIFRKGLIVFQFVLSLFIIISTVAINSQMNYIRDKELGYDAEHVVSISLDGSLKEKVVSQRATFFAELKRNPAILDVGLTTNLMGEQLSVENIRFADADPVDEQGANIMRTDEHYIDLMGIELLYGRNFIQHSDTVPVFIINERMAAALGEENPVGKMIRNDTRDETGRIVGVIKDMHYYTLHKEVEPLVIRLNPWWSDYMVVKINGTDIPRTLSNIENELTAIAPGTLVQYRFLDDKLEAFYQNDNNMNRIFNIFSVLAIVISCIGLLGLAAIEVQRRTKEIGIRKVMGATSQNIMTLLSKQFAILAAIAIVISIPISHIAINKWLENFVYRVDLESWMYLLPIVLFLATALTTVYMQAYKVVRANPTESLQNE